MSARPDSNVPIHIVRRTLRRRWPLILAVALLVTVLSALYTIARPPLYHSSAAVLLLPAAGNPFSPDSLATSQQLTVGLETEANLIDSPAVAAASVAKNGGSQPSGFVSASVVLSSQILQIKYSAHTPAEAQAGADAYARGFLAVRRSQAEAVRDDSIQRLNKQIETTQIALTKAATDAAKANPPPGSAANVQLLSSRLASLQQRLSDAEALSTNPGSIVVSATTPGHIQLLKSVLLVLVAEALGILLGFGLALWRTWADDRVDVSADLFVAGLPVWAGLGWVDREPSRLMGSGATNGQTVESYRRFRTAVLVNARRHSVLAVTSPVPVDGIAEIATNLAVSLKEAGYVVALVDAQVDKAAVAQVLRVPNSPGVSDLVSGDGSMVQQWTSELGVLVVPAGDDPAGQQDMYASERFADLLAGLSKTSDYVVLAAPPLSTASGLAVSAAAGGVSLVVVDGVTKHEGVTDLLERCRALGVSIIGSVTIARRAPAKRRDRPQSISGDATARRAASSGTSNDIPEESAQESISRSADELTADFPRITAHGPVTS